MRITVLCLPVFLAACVSDEKALDEERTSLVHEWGTCVVAQARRLTTSNESADLIAVAAVDACGRQQQTYYEANVPRMGAPRALRLTQDGRAEMQRLAVHAVIELRARR